MIAGQFDVVFRGQVVKNFELERVKNNLVQLFKSSPEAVEKLFCGSEVVIKKSLDYTTAMKYQSALKKAGALALINEVIASSSPQPSVTPQASSSELDHQETPSQFGKAQFGAAQPSPATASFTDATPTKRTISASAKNPVPQAQNEPTSQLTAPRQDENSKNAEVLSKTAAQAETTTTQAAQSGESLTVAAAGTQLLPDKIYQQRDVDTSALSLASAGERLLPESEKNDPPPPSTDHLSLLDG